MFVYFTPQDSAPDVTAKNLKERAVCVDDAAKNQFLWGVRNELGLTAWINPRGPLKQPELECFWYPVGVVQRLLEGYEKDPEFRAYVKVARGIRAYRAEAKTEYRRNQEYAILRKAAKHAASTPEQVQLKLLQLEADQTDLMVNRGRR
jgi:hypothetical protein